MDFVYFSTVVFLRACACACVRACFGEFFVYCNIVFAVACQNCTVCWYIIGTYYRGEEFLQRNFPARYYYFLPSWRGAAAVVVISFCGVFSNSNNKKKKKCTFDCCVSYIFTYLIFCICNTRKRTRACICKICSGVICDTQGIHLRT